MKKPYRVLIFPAGEANSIELHSALSSNVNVELYGSSSIDRHGSYVFKRYRSGLPLLTDNNFLEALNSLIDEWQIDIVIPTHDTVVLWLSENSASVRCKILAPPIETALVCRDKSKAYALFADASFVPVTYSDLSLIHVEQVFVKPKHGQGSVGAKLIRTKDITPDQINFDQDVVCEYLPGLELTVDCLTDSNRKLIGIFPRLRHRTLAGISVAGSTIQADMELHVIAETINERLEFCGMWFFQVKQDLHGCWKLLEISARCSGGQCLTRARGINLPLLSIYLATGHPVTIIENPCTVTVDRAFVNRYKISYVFSTVYVDYDDTLVLLGQVNVDIIRLLYQFVNSGYRIILLTRHAGDIQESFAKHRISPSLFDDIVILAPHQNKEDYINGTEAIFIDNMFTERLRVARKHGIPVFDVDSAEVMQSWVR